MSASLILTPVSPKSREAQTVPLLGAVLARSLPQSQLAKRGGGATRHAPRPLQVLSKTTPTFCASRLLGDRRSPRAGSYVCLSEETPSPVCEAQPGDRLGDLREALKPRGECRAVRASGRLKCADLKGTAQGQCPGRQCFGRGQTPVALDIAPSRNPSRSLRSLSCDPLMAITGTQSFMTIAGGVAGRCLPPPSGP